MQKIFAFIFFAVTLLISPKLVFADNTIAGKEFSTSYDVTYEVEEDASTQVTQKIILKNLTSQYYASDFTLSVGSTSVSDIKASDETGLMESKSETKDGKTAITIKLNQQIAGVGKQQAFTLKYKSFDFTQVTGKVWEINLPRLPEGTNIENYDVVVSSPVSLSDPTFIYPLPKSQTQTFDRLFFTFSKDQLDKSGISLSFGTTQIFDFTLKHHLDNTSLFPLVTSVVLPSNTAYQQVVINRLDPQPINVTVDEDGNYLAWYRVPRRSKQEITVIGSAKLYVKSQLKPPFQLSTQQKQDLVKTDQYWEKDNPSVQAALREIFKDGKVDSSHEKVRLIYQYVVSSLKYNSGRFKNGGIERLGAATVLSNPNSAVCMEFTDLFIALTRAAGIPARELDGYAYSQNKTLRPHSLGPDFLHSWPEYFDEEKGWIMVDPTWENTSGGIDYFNRFDLNHLVLVVKGASSQTPVISDDVKVIIGQNDFVGKSQIEVKVEAPETIWSGFPSTALVKITNHGNAIQEKTVLKFNTNQIKILGPSSVEIGPIPPFGLAIYTINLRTPGVFQNLNDVLEVDIVGQKIVKNIIVKPIFLFEPLPYLFIALIGVIVLIYGAILGIHIFQSKKRKKTN